jgi:copper chaperone CopZ
MERTKLALSGMTCGHCVATVRKTLANVDGVDVEQVGINAATIAYDPSRSSAEAIAAALEDAGYPVQSAVPA